MSDEGIGGQAWYSGLRPREDSAYPRKCRNCGRVFETPDDFFTETRDIRADKSGLKQLVDDDSLIMVEAFRNCPCGSTLMDYFDNRRNNSAAGRAKRKKFGELLNYLVQSGLDAQVAYAELIKITRGEESEILARMKPPK